MSVDGFSPAQLPRSGYTLQRGAERGGAFLRRTPLSQPGNSQRVSDDGGSMFPTYVQRSDPRALDTLAQLCQKPDEKRAPAQVLKSRARAKHLTTGVSGSLLQLDTPLKQQYRNAFYCNQTLIQEGGVITAKHCGTRACLSCSRIRAARAINKYGPEISSWERAYMVTLTIPNVEAERLAQSRKTMHYELREVSRAMKRTDGIPLIALRKFEITHNRRTNLFHPHFHLIVQGEAAARVLVKRWLGRFPAANAKAQDVRRCDGNSMMELFKYFTKLVTKVTAPNGRARVAPIPADALDVIFRAMVGARVFQPMGFRVAPDAPDEEAEELEIEKGTAAINPEYGRVVWEWSASARDWLDGDSGECLSGYEPPDKMLMLVSAYSDPPKEEAPPQAMPVTTAEIAVDIERARETMRRSMMALDRNRRVDPEPIASLVTTIQRIFQVGSARAAELAAEVAPPAQLSLL